MAMASFTVSLHFSSEEAVLSHTGYAKRLVNSKEMAESIVFLNSEMASYISGDLPRTDWACSVRYLRRKIMDRVKAPAR